jgi:hypothetical protein
MKKYSQAQATASRIPLGIMCKPMAGDKGVSNDEIEVVDFGATGITSSFYDITTAVSNPLNPFALF